MVSYLEKVNKDICIKLNQLTFGQFLKELWKDTDFDCINVSAPQVITVSGVPAGFNGNVTTNAFSDSHQVVAAATST